MTAHDPRVTLTEFEWASLDLILAPTDAEKRLPQVVAAVERIIAARLAPIRALADECWDLGDALRAVLNAASAPVSASQDHDGAEGQGEVPWSRQRVHIHPPYEPTCNERRVDGQLRGACLNDDGSPR